MHGRSVAGRAVAVLATAAVVGAASAPAAAQSSVPPRVVAGTAAKFYSYLTPVVVLEKGAKLVFTNLDLERHDVVQDVKVDGFGGPKKKPWCKDPKFEDGPCPAFWSEIIGLGETTKVLGLKAVKRGTIYSFYCTVHPGMKGKLIVR